MHQVNDALYHLYSDEPLEACLHECIAVGVALRADELLGWAQCELTGYPKDADVPDYRLTTVQLIGVEHDNSTTTTGPVPLDEFDISNWEWATRSKNRVPWPIGDIATTLTKAREEHRGYIIVSLLASADQLLKEGHRDYVQVYWGVLSDNFDGILKAVRATAITMLKALQNRNETDGRKTEQGGAAQSPGVVVAGKRHRINVTTNQSGVGNAGTGSDENLVRQGIVLARWQVYIGAVGLLLAAIGVILAYLALR